MPDKPTAFAILFNEPFPSPSDSDRLEVSLQGDSHLSN